MTQSTQPTKKLCFVWCPRVRTLHPSSNGARTNTVCRTTVLWSVCCTVFSIAPLDSSAKPAFSLGKPFTKFAMYIRPSTRAFSRRYMKPLLVVNPTHLHPNRLHFSNKNVTISLAIGQDFAKISSLTSPRCTHNDKDGHTRHRNSSPKSANSQPNR